MKKSLKLSFPLCFIILFVVACDVITIENNAVIQFENGENNFGRIEYKGNGTYYFKYTNTGEVPLIIQNVKTTCGCTVAKWTKKPIKPNKTGEICIVYDTKYPGRFTKTISVFYNGIESPQKLTIKGSVEFPAEKIVKP